VGEKEKEIQRGRKLRRKKKSADIEFCVFVRFFFDHFQDVLGDSGDETAERPQVLVLQIFRPNSGLTRKK
jgi:hypothetical protein